MEFVINQDKEENNDSSTEVFTIYGKQEFQDSKGFPRLGESNEDHADAYAKKIVVGKRTKYFVKRGRYGRLYNPIGLYSEGTARKQMRHAGRPEWQFKERGINERGRHGWKCGMNGKMRSACLQTRLGKPLADSRGRSNPQG